MAQSDSPAEKIKRERSLRSSGEGSSVITIPPIFREFTHFDVDDAVEIEAEVGGDEIRLRLPDNEQSDVQNES